MATLVAIDPNPSRHTPEDEGRMLLVMAETDQNGSLNIVGVNSFDVSQPRLQSSAEDGSGDFTINPEQTVLPDLKELDIDSTLALVPTRQVLYENLVLPFNDPKKVDQVVPIQVQDLLPFELDNFLIDALVLGKIEDNRYEVLASLVPQLDVSQTLERLKRLGADPKVLSTRSSAIAALPQLFPELMAGNFALILIGNDVVACAFFVDNQMKTLREFSWNSSIPTPELLTDICREIRCSLAKIERDVKLERDGKGDAAGDSRISRCFLSGPRDLLTPFSRELDRSIEFVDFSSAVTIAPSVDLNGYDITWALGLFANEIRSSKNRVPVVNFRRGAFAYKPALRNLLAALRDEAFYITLALFLGIVWCGSILYSSYAALNRVESKIQGELQTALPGVALPNRQELTILRSKVEDLEAQLKGIGSLSSLSPLESLKELSEAIGPDIDIQLEAMNISHEGLSFRGSVPNFPAVGRLNTVLESRTGRFCKVRVDSKGNAPNSSRVRFQADVTFCS